MASNGRPVAENFADWFGDSRVVDGSGEPLMLLHGTGRSFDAFDAALVGSAHVDALDGEGEEALTDRAAFYFTACRKTAAWYARDSAKRAGRQGAAIIMPVFLRMIDPHVVDFQGEGLEYLGEELVRAKALGRDGLVARNYADGSVSDHYVAFAPGQIKSAIGNSGLYVSHSASLTDRIDPMLEVRVETARQISARRPGARVEKAPSEGPR